MYDYQGRLMNARVNAFYVPGLLSTLSITASMFLDIAIVGQMLGPVAMGAVNLALPLTMVFNMVYMLLGTGGEVLVSAAKGAGNKAEANKLFSLAIFTIMAISMVIMLVGLGAENRFAAILSRGDGDMQPLLTQYIHMMFIAAPLLIGVTSMSYFVKVDALPKLAAGIMVFYQCRERYLQSCFPGTFTTRNRRGRLWDNNRLCRRIFTLGPVFVFSQKTHACVCVPVGQRFSAFGQYYCNGPSFLFGARARRSYCFLHQCGYFGCCG